MHGLCGERGWINKNINNPPPGTYSPVVKIKTNGKYPLVLFLILNLTILAYLKLIDGNIIKVSLFIYNNIIYFF